MLKQSEIYAIDGEALYNTSSVSVSMEDLEVSAERDANGYLHRERARQGVRKVSFTYEAMTQEELSQTLKRLKPEYYNLTYMVTLFYQRSASHVLYKLANVLYLISLHISLHAP